MGVGVGLEVGVGVELGVGNSVGVEVGVAVIVGVAVAVDISLLSLSESHDVKTSIIKRIHTIDMLTVNENRDLNLPI